MKIKFHGPPSHQVNYDGTSLIIDAEINLFELKQTIESLLDNPPLTDNASSQLSREVLQKLEEAHEAICHQRAMAQLRSLPAPTDEIKS